MRWFLLVVFYILMSWEGRAERLSYSITYVGRPRDGFDARAGINNMDEIGGLKLTQGAGPYQGVIWNGDAYTTLVQDGGVYALNDRNQAAGVLNLSQGGQAFFWSDGVLQTIGGVGSIALGMNDRDQVVGSHALDNNNFPFIWSGGALRDVPIAGYSSGVAYDINDRGQVVGFVEGPLSSTSSFTHPFGYDPTNGLRDLGTLGGACGGAFSINDKGQIVGYACLVGQTPSSNPGYHPFLYDLGKMTDLGTIDRLSWGLATSINSAGTVVGYDGSILNGVVQYRPFLYTDGHTYDLNTLIPAGSGWTLELANGINDQGDIAGYGVIKGVQVAFLMSPCTGRHCTVTEPVIPTPEPATYLLLAAALGVALVTHRSRHVFPGTWSLKLPHAPRN